ncbi:MAG: 30S ribosomal protein S6 [Mollicutes bacterium PWAP]|nr:30S ribosomal protein S6 [Mollicutes bacterium PWAP]
MNNYEIMMIINPKSDVKVAKDLLNKVFDKGVKSFEKMEKTELAYEINKSKTAIYILSNIETKGELIQEFRRLSNIEKNIWRIMVVNLDSERALERREHTKSELAKQSEKREKRRLERDAFHKERIAKREAYRKSQYNKSEEK